MVSFRSGLAGFGAVVALLLQPCVALPYSSDLEPSQSPNYDSMNLFGRAEPRDFYLRIMPLGASITAGEHGPVEDKEGNGYRKFLRDKLRLRGWQVNMVGSFQRGKMNDSDHEGVSGERVSEVTGRTKRAAFTWRPNVILINAGTNDATQDGDHEPVDGTGLRMKELIETIFSEVPQAVVVLSTLLPHRDYQVNVDKINAEYRSLYDYYRGYVTRDDHGNEHTPFRVVLADMADGFIVPEDIHDGTHPTIEGNRKMAAVWDWAIDQANEKGWLSPPSESALFKDGDATTTCRKQFASGNQDVRSGRQVLYASSPVIHDDGTYKHASRPRTDREVSDLGRARGTRLWFAQLINVANAPKGGERDELIWGWKVERRTIKFRLNDGDGNFIDEKELDVKDTYIRDGCPVEDIHWGDVNGDGLDDFICIASNGEMFVSLNQGGNPPTFKALGSYKTPEMGLGKEHVRLGDIDGDGRLDYCVIPGYGDIFCWRNGGIGERAAYWQNMGSGGPIFKAKGMGDIRGVRFVDVNGDGRADWIWMDENGRVTTWINQRGSDKGMVPRWLEAGVTHLGMGTNIGSDRHQVVFGRIFGDNGRADYVHYWETCSLSYCSRTMLPYENLGSGGRFQKGDGIYWGDMTGTGVDDYIWIAPDGEAWVFLNKNTREQSDFYATPAWSTPIPIKTGLDRRALHIGDWDGDGKADIIGVTNRNTGSLKVWHSRWDGNQFNWDIQDIPDSAKCNQGWGLGYFDNGAHFADISGSGRVDYLCMEPSGRTTAWLRDKDGNWFNAGQVKFHEDLDRANFRFADVNGDGRADLVWTDKFSGDARVWYNMRQASESERGNLGGSLFEWERPVNAYLGSSRGPNMYFPNLGGQGRADMVGTNPTTAHAWVWFNSCPGGGDDWPEGEAVPDPALPHYAPPARPDPSPEDPDEHWFCGGNGGTWTPQLWNDHRMGRWLVLRSELYMGPDAAWPADVAGVPRVIAHYNGLTKDNAWDWPADCRFVGGNCNHIPELADTPDCVRTPERPFALWAMKNFALFLQRWKEQLENAIGAASLFTAEFADTFISYNAQEPAGEVAWLTIVSGLFGSLGAFIPAGGATGLAAGLFTVAAGQASLASVDPPFDPRFTNFAAAQANLGRAKIEVMDTMDRYFRRTLAETPPGDHWERGTELARILENGAFADQDITITPSNSTMTRWVQASLISGMWNTGNVAIIKWSKDHKFATEYGFSPCFGRPGYRLDQAVACVMDHNFLITRLAVNGMSSGDINHVRSFPDVGQSDETLEKYDLSQLKVIRSAMKTQEAANAYLPTSDAMQKILDSITNNPSENLADFLPLFNIPVCDLDKLSDLVPQTGFCQMLHTDNDYSNRCIQKIISDNCRRLPLGGSQWPYVYDGW